MDAIPSVDLSSDLRVMDYKTSSDRLIDALVDYTNLPREENPNDALVTLFTHGMNFGPDMMAIAIEMNNKGEEKSKAFKDIRSIPAVDNTHKVLSLPEAATGSKIPGGFRYV